ncbi:MAG TPA: XdhC family protein [Steroidobacteraceae bacterium]|jgi:xanthine/CO dehydrogenase XdhC/CoxF family maturation factor|nr:XdhC family protein [Steroidobacteraceae bacterium]
METLIAPLLPLYERERRAGRAVALAVVVHTTGSTYRKPGALMLIAADGQYAGLLSGGCLESDLREHALQVIGSGSAKLITYDTRGADDLLWGLGVGCEGAMQILLLRVGPESAWQPLDLFVSAHQRHERVAAAVVVASPDATLPAGSIMLREGQPGGHAVPPALQDAIQALLARALETGRPSLLGSHSDALRALAMPLALPPRLLLLGGGPDAQPLVDFADRLSWRVTVYDHRPAYAQRERFPAAEQVTLGRPESLAQTVALDRYDAAIVMSHHLPSDLIYLRALSRCTIPYVGLLGPVARREKLLGDLGSDAERLNGRLRSPIGLNIGGRAPESIALSIVAEIHARLHGAPGSPF